MISQMATAQATNAMKSREIDRSKVKGGFLFLCNMHTEGEVMERHVFGLPKKSEELDSLRNCGSSEVVFFLFNLSTRVLTGCFEPEGQPYEDQSKSAAFKGRFKHQWKFKMFGGLNQ